MTKANRSKYEARTADFKLITVKLPETAADVGIDRQTFTSKLYLLKSFYRVFGMVGDSGSIHVIETCCMTSSNVPFGYPSLQWV